MTNIQPAEKRIAVFFDFDNTLLAGDGAKIGIRYLWEQNEAKLPYILRVMFANIFFKRRLMSIEKMADVLLSFYKGKELAHFEAESENYYREVIKPRLAPTPMAKLEEHRSQGHFLVLLTGSVDYLMVPVANDLQFDKLICTHLETGENGLLTGKSDGPPVVGVIKAEKAKKLAEEFNLDLRQSFAYGDHISDLPLLETVGNPIVVEPDAALERIAQDRGWEKLSYQ